MPDLDAALRKLKRDRASAKWDARTAGGAPHKPLVLLALCDVAEAGLLEQPFAPFEGPTFDALARAFQFYWSALFPDAPPGALWLPLWHLRSDAFWSPQPRGSDLPAFAPPLASPAAPFASSAVPTASPAAPLSSSAAPSASPAKPSASSAAPSSSPAAPLASPVVHFASPAAPSASPAVPFASPAAPSASPAVPGASTSIAAASGSPVSGYLSRDPSSSGAPRVQLGRPVGLAALREHHSGARLDPELFRRLHDPLAREDLRALLLGLYFDEPTRHVLAQRIAWNRAAELYARSLLRPNRGQRIAELANDVAAAALPPEPARSQGFRIAVLSAYEHRCAACGLRVQTPDGLTAVQAAHIKPWSLFRDDRLANGLALCPTCHWTFDNFLWSTRPPRRITTSRSLRFARNLPAHLEALDGRDLLAPPDPALSPDPTCLAWHRSQVVA